MKPRIKHRDMPGDVRKSVKIAMREKKLVGEEARSKAYRRELRATERAKLKNQQRKLERNQTRLERAVSAIRKRELTESEQEKLKHAVRTNLVTTQLGLEPPANRRYLIFGYGTEELHISFTMTKAGFDVAVTEDEFAKNPDRQREVAIIGFKDPTEAVRLIVKHYPRATLFVRKEPRERKRPR
jgi:hypothetical protein